ncbi:MAG: hypothetical protein KAH01_03665 [Caldisericia bacterium]|nr:hypothetical protein [Caldisericia bacterium]
MKKIFSVFLSSILFLSVFSTALGNETKEIKLTVGNTTAEVNGEKVTLDVPPTVVNGRTLVPLRFIAESFGAEVAWDGPTRTITLTAPDLDHLKLLVENLTKNNEELKANLEKLEIEKEQLTKENTELKGKVGMMDTLITKLEDQISVLLEENKELKAENKELKEKIAEGNDKTEDTEAPIITIKNLKAGDTLNEEKLRLEVLVEDASKVVFSRVKLNTIVLSETLGDYGEIDPAKMISGEYNLTIEAIDGCANIGNSSITFIVAHDAKKEPIRFILKAIDAKGMMGGGGGGPHSVTLADSSQPYLVGEFSNKSSASIELVKIDTYDAEGNVFEIMPGMNFFDLAKEQMGLPKHLVIVQNDKYTAPCAISMKEVNSKPEDYFDGWKVKITLFDSIRELEFTKTIRYSK